jgi:tight adherence protein C
MTAALLAFASAALAAAGAGCLMSLAPRRAGAGRVGLAARIAEAVPARLRPPLDLAARIEAAGSPAGLGARELMALKAAAALACAPPGTAFGSLVPGRLGLLVIAGSPAAGFFAPDVWLARRTRARLREARRDLPGLLDLLRVAVEAGLAPAHALRAVAERSEAPLAREWGTVARQAELGVPLAEALDGLTRRLPAVELKAFCGALTRAARHGAPLSDTLAAQARDARQARRRRIEEEAARASPKIQLVVALLLVPSVLLIVAAALAAAMLGGHGGVLPR